MTLREFIQGLNDFVKENPNSGGMVVVTSKDDEGNGYNRVCFGPCIGNFNEDEKEFKSHDQIIEPENEYDKEDYPLNAVCVN